MKTIQVTVLSSLLAMCFAGCEGCFFILEDDDDVDTTVPGALIALYPGDGAAAVPLATRLIVEVGDDLATEAVVIGTLTGSDGSTRGLDCKPTADDTLLDCPAGDDLAADTDYTFATWVEDGDGTVLESRFTTAHPEGLAYEIGEMLTIVQVGGDSSASPLLDSLLGAGSPMLLVSEGIASSDDLPATDARILWGPGNQLTEAGENVYAVNLGIGYAAAVACTIDATGTLLGEASHAFLPVGVDGEWLPVRIEDVVLQGNLTPDEEGMPITALGVEAEIPQISIDRIRGALDPAEALVLDALIELDVDINGDGSMDAAHLSMTTEGLPITIHTP